MSMPGPLTTGPGLADFAAEIYLKGSVRRFVSAAGTGVQYEPFRDLVLARMQDDRHKPAGMQRVVDQILGAQP